jgi:hypothetical protein
MSQIPTATQKDGAWKQILGRILSLDFLARLNPPSQEDRRRLDGATEGGKSVFTGRTRFLQKQLYRRA